MYFAAERPVFFLFYWKDPSHGLCGNEQHNAFITYTDFVQFVLLTYSAAHSTYCSSGLISEIFECTYSCACENQRSR